MRIIFFTLSLSASLGFLRTTAIADNFTPEQVIQSALLHHPRVRALAERRSAIAGERLSAEGAFDPAVVSKLNSYLAGGYSGTYSDVAIEQPMQLFGSQLFAGYRKGAGTFPIYDDYYSTNSGGETRLGVQVPILRNREIDERRAKIAETDAKGAAAEFDITQARNEVARDALQAYWTWVAAGNRYQVYRDLVTVAEQRNDQLEQQVTHGDIAAIVLTDNQRALLKRRSELLKGSEFLQRAALQLSLFSFDEHGNSLLPSEGLKSARLPEPTLRDFGNPDVRVSEALRQRPELRSVDEKLRGVSAQQKFAQNQMLPELNASLITADDHGGGTSRRGELEVKGGVEVKVPFYMRKARGMVATTDAASRELERIRTLYEQKIDREVRKALVALAIITERIAVQRDEVKAARELEEGERMRFTQGDSNLIFVNLREQTTADAQLALIDAILDYHVYRADLDAAVGEIAAP